MNRQQVAVFYELTRSVRRLFHKLGAGVGALHADSEVSAGMRALLETLTAHGPLTVPEMARMRPVTRQHVQALVNSLLDLGYVEALNNPAHRRSKLIAVTPSGTKAFKAMRSLENEAFRHVELDIAAEELRSANEVLRKLIDVLDGTEWRTVAKRHVDPRAS